jgi:hypothetical protein
MKTVEKLIVRVRRETRNATTGATTAGASISDAEFVDVLQDGQEVCQEMIAGVFSKVFEVTTTSNVTANNEIVTLPTGILLGTRVLSVEFTYGSDVSNYYNLTHVDIRERESSTATERRMRSYARSGNSIILMQIPAQAGLLRVVYEQEVPRLDVTKIPITTKTTVVSDASNLAWTAGTEHTDVSDWVVGQLVNVMDTSDNSFLAKNAEITAIDVGAGTISLLFTGATDYAEATFNSATQTNLRLIEAGRTNVSELPNACEKFLVAYAKLEMLERDASKLARAAERRYNVISETLLKSYIQEDKDMPAIPETEY